MACLARLKKNARQAGEALANRKDAHISEPAVACAGGRSGSAQPSPASPGALCSFAQVGQSIHCCCPAAPRSVVESGITVWRKPGVGGTVIWRANSADWRRNDCIILSNIFCIFLQLMCIFFNTRPPRFSPNFSFLRGSGRVLYSAQWRRAHVRPFGLYKRSYQPDHTSPPCPPTTGPTRPLRPKQARPDAANDFFWGGERARIGPGGDGLAGQVGPGWVGVDCRVGPVGDGAAGMVWPGGGMGHVWRGGGAGAACSGSGVA